MKIEKQTAGIITNKDNSTGIEGDRNIISITTKQKMKWSVGGVVLSIVIAFITELIEQGKVSELLADIINLFK